MRSVSQCINDWTTAFASKPAPTLALHYILNPCFCIFSHAIRIIPCSCARVLESCAIPYSSLSGKALNGRASAHFENLAPLTLVHALVFLGIFGRCHFVWHRLGHALGRSRPAVGAGTFREFGRAPRKCVATRLSRGDRRQVAARYGRTRHQTCLTTPRPKPCFR